MKILLVMPLALLVIAALPVTSSAHIHNKTVKLAQTHQHRGTHTAKSSAPAPSTAAYQAANAKMHKSMDIKFSGNADVDFARGMIPHHQGAIDMAKVVLAHGKNPEIRKLAQEIIKAQESEIAWMKEWLKNAQ